MRALSSMIAHTMAARTATAVSQRSVPAKWNGWFVGGQGPHSQAHSVGLFTSGHPLPQRDVTTAVASAAGLALLGEIEAGGWA